MFDIGWTELLVIAVVAIVIIGPKDLPRAMRAVGQWTGRVKRMAGDFQRQFNEAVREAELDDVKNEVTKLGKMDPVGDLKKTIAKADTDLKADLKKVNDDIATSAASLDKPDTVNAVPKPPVVTPDPVVAADDPEAAPVVADPAAPPPTREQPVVPPPSVPPPAADPAPAGGAKA